MNVRIEQGDCLEVMARLAAEGVSVDCIFTDPPYHLRSIVERFGKEDSAPAKSNGKTGLFNRESRAFLGQSWDGGDIAFQADVWKAAYALLKPGGHMISFSHSTTYHRMAVAIEDAGFEIRDMIDWIYGTGVPKSRNQHGEFEGYGSALKPAKEPAALARRPLSEGSIKDNLIAHGTGALNIDALRIPIGDGVDGKGRWPANVTHDGSEAALSVFPVNQGSSSRYFQALSSGRLDDWQANVVYCSKTPSNQRVFRCSKCGHRDSTAHEVCGGCGIRLSRRIDENELEAEYLSHPTVKPVSMVAYWLQGICPPGGTVLDPFAGTGSTAIAAMTLGLNSIVIDSDEESIADIRYRVARVSGADTPLFGGI